MERAPLRSLGLADVVGLGINCVIGSGIFLLPGLIADKLGPASTLAVVLAGTLAFLIALCFAETASRFTETGGAYVYARAAFGELIGFEVGWMALLAGIVAWGALVNGFAVALAHLVPAVEEGLPRTVTIILFVTALGALNVRGAKLGARASNLFTVAKLVVLFSFVVAGALFIAPARFHPFAPQGYAPLGEATLIILYAYMGFENMVVPAGEMLHPQRAIPLALMAIMTTVTLLYLAVQAVALGTLPSIAGAPNAVADAAGTFLGSVGGGIIAVGIVLSIIGVNAASALILPRRLFALAVDGAFPALLRRVHARHGTPAPAIVLTHLVVALMALTGSFRDLAVLAVLARFMQYVPTCLAVLVLRYRDTKTALAAPSFRIPGGPLVPLVALALCGWLLAAAKPAQLAAGALALLAGLVLYVVYVVGQRSRPAA